MDFSRLLLILGKFHPIAVHFPIVLIAVAALCELFQVVRRKEVHPATAGFAIAVVPFTIVTTILGLANAASDDFHGDIADLLFVHRIGGIVLAVASVLLAWLAFRASHGQRVKVFRGLLFAMAGLVGFVGHYGGLMVHGPDYFSSAFEREGSDVRASLRPIALGELPPPADGKVDFAKTIHPLLEANCGKCHADGRSKGGFRIDTRDLILKGGETGPGAVPGKSADSHLIKLVAGIDPKKVMPNKGRRLTPEEIGELRAWIDQGLPWDGQVESKHALIAKVSYKLSRPELPSGTDSANPIDRIVRQYFSKRGVLATTTIDDRRFARKLYLDVLGVLPSPQELSDFLSDDSADRRVNLVRRVLSDNHRFALHWLTFWNDHLRNDYSGPGFLHGGREDITRWLYASLYRNKPFNEFASDLINPNDDTRGFVHGVRWWRAGNVNANEDPSMQAAQNVSQLFMGVNIKCASCHDSFVDQWKLSDAYGLANVYAPGRLTTHECNAPTGVVQAPKFLYPELGEIQLGGAKFRKESLARLMTSDENGRFARTIVNRTWGRLFGRGIVEPIDEMDNPPWSPELLDWLASELIAQKYDIRKFMERVLTSRAYQLPTQGARERYPKDWVFEGPVVRRIGVEQLFDSIAVASHTAPAALSGDVERAIAVTVANPILREGGAPIDGDPRILARSGVLDGASKSVKIEAQLGKTRSLWLVAVKQFATKSTLEKEREKFEKVSRQDDGLVEIGTGSSQLKKDKQGQKTKGKKRTNTVGQEFEVLWEQPMITRSKGARIDLTKFARTSYLERIEVENDEVDSSGVSLASFEDVSLKTENRVFKANAFSAIRFDLSHLEGGTFTANVKVNDTDAAESHKVEFLLVADLDLRSVFLEATSTLLALGRPRREQIATSRPTVATTMQAFEMTNGPGLTDLIERASHAMAAEPGANTENLVTSAYERLLGRAPSPSERDTAIALLRDESLQEQAADLIWSLTMLPEFQLLM